MCNNLSFFLPLLSSLLKIFAKIVYMLQISTICPVLMVTGCRDSHQCSDNTSQHSIGNSLGSILTYQTNQSRIRRVESSIGHSSVTDEGSLLPQTQRKIQGAALSGNTYKRPLGRILKQRANTLNKPSLPISPMPYPRQHQYP
nr:PREDICTED: uncharacterized protein LOC108213833 isoform X2 [Daucus carota subsp. sativus]